MSAGFQQNINRTNWYTNEERWVDHMEGPHGISFVKSAGNKGETNGDITSPGMAYNAITVGAIEDKDTLDTSDDILAFYSSYANNGSSDCAKPDVLATGNIYSVHGTSFSAPVVSGVIAQMMEYKPSLKTNSRLVKAVLLASCDRKTSESRSLLTAKEGAGEINALRAYVILSNQCYASGYFSTPEITFSVRPSEDASIALTWARLNSVPANHLGNVTVLASYVNLNLFIYRSDGSYLTSSELTTSSAEVLCFSSSFGTTYTVKIRKADPAQTSNTVWYSLAWY